ncbi:MAG: putative zinc-binding metallopeptidase [Caulobacter sp.]|nr:putative zinc-binding metallopeptidase [Vitreoscilla sp.]
MNTTLSVALGPTTSRSYHCVRGALVFLRNTTCLHCGHQLGYDTDRRTMVAIEPAPVEGLWVIAGESESPTFGRCLNLETAAACNWLIPRASTDAAHWPANLYAGRCLSCSLTRTIPNLESAHNGELWRRLETAKRRLLSQLLALALPVETRLERSNGIVFDFLEHVEGCPPVLTGHDEGLITLNIGEADDSQREKIRAKMHESYRTLLGHFRHEIGHYYWDRLVRDTAWLEGSRQLFGDDTIDYAKSLKRHYENGPPADWRLHYVTSYATSHPWEDWAETWAHYLHMSDTVDTAVSLGVDSGSVDIETEPYTSADLWQPDHPNAQPFLAFLNSWVVLTQALNELTRSMGQPDFYPFVLPREAVAKLQFIHEVIRSASVPAPAVANDPLTTHA